MMIVGAKLKNATVLSAVARPVTCQAQTLIPKDVMADPMRETTWPAQMHVNPFMPFGLACVTKPSPGILTPI